MESNAELALELRGITKRFPGVVANDDVSLSVRRGDIHALVGENGAGKSTLMSVLFGLIRPDEGEIHVDGRRVEFHSSIDAIRSGLGMVFQSFKLFPSLTVSENVVFREEPSRLGWIDRARTRRQVQEISDRYGLAVDPDARVADLPVGVLQRVEILKALYRRAQVLILDEPTAVLTPQETDALFEILRGLAADGRTIVIITHKLREVMALSSRITVLRDGRVTANLETSRTGPDEITRHMTGRRVQLVDRRTDRAPGEAVLTVNDLSVGDRNEQRVVDAVSLQVRAGEIVGVAGIAGNGQTELAQAIAGLVRSTGTVTIDGADVSHLTPRGRREAGLSYIPEDRHEVGSVATASATDNLAIGYHRAAPLEKRGLLRKPEMIAHARRLIDLFRVKIASPSTHVGTLSGGNLQKIVIARELTHGAPLLIAEQPTRGVDIGAIEFIHEELARYRDSGHGILLISAELSELLSLSQRILVMYEGCIAAEVPADVASEHSLGLLMAGERPDPQEGE